MLIRNIPLIFLCVFMSIYMSAAFAADCSDSRIRTLAGNGKTVRAISVQCDVSRSYVTSVLDEDEPEEEEEEEAQPANRLAPAGTAVSACGCHGMAYQGAQIPDNRCQSGVAVVNFCNAMCSGGGFMWQTYCR